MNNCLAVLGLPINASAQGHDVDRLIYFVHLLMFALFIGWFIYFVYVLIRFNKKRNPKPDYEGVKTHASTYVEAAVALIEAALLLGLALPIWSRQVDHFPSEKESTVINVIAQQFQWNGWYPGTNGVFVKADRKLVAGDNPFGFDKTDANFKNNFVVIGNLEVPVDKPVLAYISSQDVIHSFACRPLRAMQDAIPGMRIPLHFTPALTGEYQINCAQLCGISHSAMRGTIKVVKPEEFTKWVASKSSAGAGAGGGYE
ncbi:MAG TPA: cytochrome c oxidase subunit II [Verrucomicrobiae bacterium]|jgi:cytochrome c oxidase subunit 2|nr:cytochrome c oxidase subunit II [Verrucomicrobiae bacterium]